MSAKLPEAVAYLRTSSATNSGPDKDSERRQREAIEAFAKRSGFGLVEASLTRSFSPGCRSAG